MQILRGESLNGHLESASETYRSSEMLIPLCWANSQYDVTGNMSPPVEKYFTVDSGTYTDDLIDNTQLCSAFSFSTPGVWNVNALINLAFNENPIDFDLLFTNTPGDYSQNPRVFWQSVRRIVAADLWVRTQFVTQFVVPGDKIRTSGATWQFCVRLDKSVQVRVPSTSTRNDYSCPINFRLVRPYAN